MKTPSRQYYKYKDNIHLSLLTRREACTLIDDTKLIDIIEGLQNDNLPVFDDIYDLAEHLLIDIKIDNIVYNDISECDYFILDPAQIYNLCIESLRINFPGFFFMRLGEKQRFISLDRADQNTEIYKITSRIKQPVTSLSDSTSNTFRLAKYYNISPIDTYNMLNRDFLDLDEYMCASEDVEEQVQILQSRGK